MPCHGTCLTELETTGDHGSHADPFSDLHATPHYPPRLPLRPTHLSLSLTLSIPEKSVVGSCTHTLLAQWPGAHTITIHAEDFSHLHVSSPDDEHLTYAYDGHAVQVAFSIPLETGQSVAMKVDYEVRDPIDGLLFSGAEDGVFVVSDHETERARYWLPVVDHPSVRTTVSFELKTKAEDALTVLANGEDAGETVVEGMKVTKWEMRQVVPSYLICIAVGQFIRADSGTHNGKKIAFFAPKGGRHKYTEEHLALTFGRTKEMIAFMESKVRCDMPWPKYYQFAVGEVGGAMENSSLVSYDEWYMLDERSTDERAHRVDSTVVHELAHTWFGDLVVCSDFCHSFLKESFATLISAEWYHHKHGVDEFQHTLMRYAEVSFQEAAEYMRPIVTRKYENSWSLFDRHLYTNGAWRLHMLRVKLGDERFWKAVSAYLHKRAWKTVEADDFRRDLEEFSGEELISYFEQWFYGKGHPVLDVSFAYDASKGGYATITIKQTQADEKKGVGVFDITIDIAMETTSGEWETHTLTMESGAASAQYIAKIPTKPLQLVVDPEKKVLHHLAKLTGVGDDMCIRSLAQGPTYAGRYQAARLLHEGGSRRGRIALKEALVKECHWGLRHYIATWMGKSGRLDFLPALIDSIETESDARVTLTILTAISAFQEKEAEQALLKYAMEGHENLRPYGAIAAALRGLGKMRNVEHLDLLASFLEDKKKGGNNFEIPQGAAAGLGNLRDWGGVKVLMRNLKPRNEMLAPRVRVGIVNALGTGVAWEGFARRCEMFEFLERIVMGDEVKSVRMAAGNTLAGLGDVGNVGKALDELEKRVENQAKSSVRGYRRKARRAAGRSGGVKGGNAAVEKLTGEVAELRAKVEEMKLKIEAKCKNERTDEKESVVVD